MYNNLKNRGLRQYKTSTKYTEILTNVIINCLHVWNIICSSLGRNISIQIGCRLCDLFSCKPTYCRKNKNVSLSSINIILGTQQRIVFKVEKIRPFLSRQWVHVLLPMKILLFFLIFTRQVKPSSTYPQITEQLIFRANYDVIHFSTKTVLIFKDISLQAALMGGVLW